jgi:hypothetical protein
MDDIKQVPFEVKHKYIRRTGRPGNYTYFYRDEKTGRTFSSDKELGKKKPTTQVTPKKQANKIMDIDNTLWDKVGATHGGELKKKWSSYKKLVKEKIKPVSAEDSKKVYDILEDNNFHSINAAMRQLGLFEKDPYPDASKKYM